MSERRYFGQRCNTACCFRLAENIWNENGDAITNTIRHAPTLCSRMSQLLCWFFLGLLMPSCLVAQQKPSDEFRIFDGQATRLFMTGNSHHPTYGLDKLARLLDRYFDGKSPIVVAGLADARKDPITQKPIPPAKLTELIRFLEPEFTARAKQPEPRERLVILNYVIVNAPRKEADGAWVKTDADALQAYAQMAIERGAQRVF